MTHREPGGQRLSFGQALQYRDIQRRAGEQHQPPGQVTVQLCPKETTKTLAHDYKTVTVR